MKKFFCAWLAKLLVFLPLVSGNVFGQSAPLPRVPPLPSAPTRFDVFCGSAEDLVLFSNQGDKTVRTLCFGEDQKETGKSEVLMRDVPGVTHIFPASDLGDFYTISNANKVYKFVRNPWDGQNVRSYRTFGGVPFNPDPVYHETSEYGDYYWTQTGLSFRFPLEKEAVTFSLNGDSTSFQKPLASDPRLGCVSVVALRSEEYCLDPKTNTVFRPDKNPFTNAWKTGTDFFANRQPVNMAVGNDKLYVSLAGRGEIVALGYTSGRMGKDFGEETVMYNVGIFPDAYQSRLAVSQNGLYFVHRTNGGGPSSFRDEIWFRSAKTGRVYQIWSGRDGETLSGLAVGSSQSAVYPPSVGGGKG